MTNARIGNKEIRTRVAGIAVVLTVITLTVFFPVVHHDFVDFDDPDYVPNNPHVRAGLTWEGVKWALRTWHPVTWVSLMLDVTLFGDRPGGLHAVNLLLHTGSAVLLFSLFRNLTGSLWRSAFVSALFALHPLQVESVAWIAERKGVLSTFFALLTLCAYSRYALSGQASSKARIRYYLLAILFFVLGLMSKPMLVTLPCLLLLLDYWPLRRLETSAAGFPGRLLVSLVREKVPFFVLSGVASFTTVWFQKEAGVLQTFIGYSASSRIENAVISYPHYLGKLLWPVNLATPYPRVYHWPAELVFLAFLLIAGLCFLAIRFARRQPFTVTGWFWFLGMLIPVLGFIQVGAQAVADRYAYLPCIGIFVLLTWFAGDVVARWQMPKYALGSLAVVMLIACAAQTRHQLQFWRNTESLCLHAIAVTRDNWLAHQLLGTYYSSQGRSAEAMKHFRISSQIKPNYADPWNGMGCLLADQGDFTNAIPCFESAVRARPDMAEVRYNLARALGICGRHSEAMEQYRLVLQQKPDLAAAHGDLGLLLVQSKRLDEAKLHLQAAVRYAPTNAVLRRNLGNILLGMGKVYEAIPVFRVAHQLAPDNIDTQNMLASVLAAAGKLDEAIAQFQVILQARPESPAAHFNLGKALAAYGKTNEAIPHFREALRLDPSFAAAKSELQRLTSIKN